MLTVSRKLKYMYVGTIRQGCQFFFLIKEQIMHSLIKAFDFSWEQGRAVYKLNSPQISLVAAGLSSLES